MERKTFREVIRDIKEGEVWEDIENKDSRLKIFIDGDKFNISSKCGIKGLEMSIDTAIFRRIK